MICTCSYIAKAKLVDGAWVSGWWLLILCKLSDCFKLAPSSFITVSVDIFAANATGRMIGGRVAGVVIGGSVAGRMLGGRVAGVVMGGSIAGIVIGESGEGVVIGVAGMMIGGTVAGVMNEGKAIELRWLWLAPTSASPSSSTAYTIFSFFGPARDARAL